MDVPTVGGNFSTGGGTMLYSQGSGSFQQVNLPIQYIMDVKGSLRRLFKGWMYRPPSREQLFYVGRRTVNSLLDVGRRIENSLIDVGSRTVNSLLDVGRPTVRCWPPNSQMLAANELDVGRQTVRCWPPNSQMLAAKLLC